MNLSEYETRRKSNIWDSDIDRGISVIYNGGKSNISSSEREYLVEKVVKDGINWTAGSDEDKREFFKEILNGNDESALADIWHMYDYKYRKRGVIEGRNWKNIFSEDYIRYYIEKIFNSLMAMNYYVWDKSFDYESMFKEGFQKIADTINSDFDRGARGTHFVKTDNYDRIEELAEELKRVDIDITYILLNLKRFKAEDVTEKLMGIFREAKREGERLKERYIDWYGYITTSLLYDEIKEELSKEHPNIAKVNNLFDKKMEIILLNIENYFLDFIDLVKSWGPYDIKRRFSWSQDLQYIFDGRVIDFDDTGNMAYGVLAKASGMSDNLMQVGAGGYNLWEAIGGTSSIKGLLKGDEEAIKRIEKGWEYEKHWWRTYFDDPRDNEAVKKGIEYYYRL